jgi:putative ABC transport system permease protein
MPIAADMQERRLVSRFLVAQADNPTAIVGDIKRIVWSHDPNQPVLRVDSAAALMADTIRRERFLLMLMSLFSAVALALASAGIFGVLAYAVAQRANEFGIRMALGASPTDILRLVVGHGLVLAGAGTAVGVSVAYAFSRVLAGLLYEVDPRDPVVFIAIPALVFAVALLASWIPTVRAVRVDPVAALRME